MGAPGMQAPAVDGETSSFSARQLGTRLFLTLAALVLLSVGLSHWFKPQLEGLSRRFYEEFGVVGPAIGTWLADGFNFPIPPQAYMLLAEARGATAEVFPAIVIGSLLGGVSGYLVAPVLLKFHWVRAIVERTEGKVRALCDDRWVVTTLLLSVSPIAFSWLCYSASMYRVPRRTFALLCLMRIPKLAVYQQLISWGWS
jgi:membrane protein YqaA with SNARE-associated domain